MLSLSKVEMYEYCVYSCQLTNQTRMLFELCCMTEEFVTPLSTPPSETEDAAAAADTGRPSDLGESVTSGLSESAIYDKIYET